MKFDMSEAWRQATAMIAANREVLLVVAGLFFFLPSVALGFALGDVQSLMMEDASNAQDAVLAAYSSYWWLFLLVLVFSIIGYLTLLALLRDVQRPTVGEALRIAGSGLLPAVGAYLIFSVGMGLMLVLLVGIAAATGSTAAASLALLICFVGFLYAGVKVSLAGPVIAIEKMLNPVRVLGRSWRLTKGNSFRLFVFYMLLVIAYIVVSMFAGLFVTALVFLVGSSAGLIINAVLTGLLSAVITTVLVAVLAAAHRQLAGPSAQRLSETFE